MTITVTSYTNGKHNVPYESFTFSGGEEHIRFSGPRQYAAWDVHITAILTSSAEIIKLAMVTDAIRRHADNVKITLKMPYIPYARQDRVCVEGEALGIRVFCDIINAMQFDRVHVLMPHSEVAPALLNNCDENLYTSNWNLFIPDSIPRDLKNDLIIVSPDAGAMKRTLGFAQMLNTTKHHRLPQVDVVMADKVRDVVTGQITSTAVHAGPELVGKVCLIYDDICDGGFTFIKLAEALREKGASKVILAVPHGIFSKGFTEIAKVIDQVITTNIFKDNIPEHTSIPVSVFDITRA
jgi:ribose-phosphate pyrophosphokinase